MSFHCKTDVSLTKEEKAVFAGHLETQGMSGNIWELFGDWVKKSTPQNHFFYLKVYQESELVGLGLFLRIKPFDLRSSYARLRKNALLKTLAGGISALSNNCVYVSFRNLITSNLTRPFFYRELGMEESVMRAILTFLRNEKEADMVTIVDTTTNDPLYQQEGFSKYPSSSEAYLDATGYHDISEYLAKHRSLKKNLARKKKRVTTEILRSPVSEIDIQQMKACVACSVVNSRVSNPCQRFFEENIFETHVFHSSDYIHIVIRVDGIIVPA